MLNSPMLKVFYVCRLYNIPFEMRLTSLGCCFSELLRVFTLGVFRITCTAELVGNYLVILETWRRCQSDEGRGIEHQG